jgi:dTDP-4-dehydrorhamnose reductase
MAKPTILVTGANGQLGKEIQQLEKAYPLFTFLFLSRADLPIHHFELVSNFFAASKPAFCINCAAYTAVDKAETEKDLAMLVNAEAVGVLASVCKLYKTRFIHISTDYVFDGSSSVPYKEDHPTNPVNFYGQTKLKGEELCLVHEPESIVIRTSWVYSEFGNNFVKTMIRLMKEKESINVVSDQRGAPTYAADLAKLILHIIEATNSSGSFWKAGVYHYSNKGNISWYDFAVAIKDAIGSSCKVNPIPTTAYPTPAKRPSFSAFDTQKIQAAFGINIPAWEDSLKICIRQISA